MEGEEGGGVNVESRKGAFAVFNLWGSCDENCFKAVFVFKGGGASGGVSCRGRSDGGEEISGDVGGSSKDAPSINSMSPFPPNLEGKRERQESFIVKNNILQGLYFRKFVAHVLGKAQFIFSQASWRSHFHFCV